MATSVVMPALEMAQETGKIVSWVKKEGEPSAKGEVLLEVETDKAVVEIEATTDGVLAGVKSQEGDVVPVGTTIAWIVAPGEVRRPNRHGRGTGSPNHDGDSRALPPRRARTRGAAAAPTAAKGRVPQISPKARRLAQRKRRRYHAAFKEPGPDGTITSEDVLKAAETAAPAPAPASAGQYCRCALSAIARLMAERTTQSWTQVPHFFLVRDLDAGALMKRGKTGASESTKASSSPIPTFWSR